MGPLLQAGRVIIHDWIIGALALGNLGNRQAVLGLLQGLARLASVTEEEVLNFIEHHRLMGRGIGYIDVHLLAAAAVHSAVLWARDKRLKEIAAQFGLAYAPDRH